MKKLLFSIIPIIAISSDLVEYKNLLWEDSKNTKKLSYEQASNYCKNLEINGITNFRIPTVEELESIIDKTKFKPAIKDNFTNTDVYDWYWSSTKKENSKVQIVLFYRGYFNSDNKNSLHNVRCVKDK
jgi:hypothetical protein